MKRYFFGSLLLALFAVFSLSLVSCSDDDEDDGNTGGGGDDGGTVEPGKYALSINGEVWNSRADYEPLYEGQFYAGHLKDEVINAAYVYGYFYRDDYLVYYGASTLHFEINVLPGYEVTKGLDIATSDVINWSAGDCEWTLTDGAWGSTNAYNVVYYGGEKGCSGGSAIVEDLSEDNFITINFTNFRLPLLSVRYEGKGNVAETLTLDGTVTFMYIENYL